MSASVPKKRKLSQDSTSSEGDGTVGHKPDPSSESIPKKQKLSEDITKEEGKCLSDNLDEDEHMKWLMSFKEIAGRYTEEDPNFANDVERKTPPLVLGYRKHKKGNQKKVNKAPKSGHRGKGDFKQNRGKRERGHRSNHGNGAYAYQRYEQHQTYRHHLKNNNRSHPYKQGHHFHHQKQTKSQKRERP